MHYLIAVAGLFAATPAETAGDAAADTDGRTLAAAVAQLQQRRPAAVIATLAPVVARFDAAAAKDGRQTYCAINPTQTIAYLGLAAGAKRAAVAVKSSYCEALFLTGFALIDLGRIDEAQATYRRLIALAPMNAHYQIEYGQSFRRQRKWAEMRSTCAGAEAYVGVAANPDYERRAAWRCQGYALIELGRLDDAEALFRKALASDPNDGNAKNELTYIAQQRAKSR